VTASALMIGLALITFVAVLGHGLQRSVGEAVDRVVRADYVVTADDGSGPLAPAVTRTLASQPGVETVSGVRRGPARVFGGDTSVDGVDPATIAGVATFDWVDGSDATFAALGASGAVLQRRFADDHHLDVGDRFAVRTAQGRPVELAVRGIYAPPTFDAVLGPILVSRQLFDATFERPRDVLALVDGAVNRRALERALVSFPEVDLQTRAEFADRRGKEIADLLSLLYVLLALSVVVSLFGMVNTVALAVFERTRELGMLRAIGMTRRQVRRMIRHESVLTGLIGAALGMPLGIFLAALVTRGLADEGVVFSVPVSTLVVFALVAAVAGVLAAILPARRASRLDVVTALAYE
jgi:putative ABC transport system permease protein